MSSPEVSMSAVTFASGNHGNQTWQPAAHVSHAEQDRAAGRTVGAQLGGNSPVVTSASDSYVQCRTIDDRVYDSY